jgi:hypothetical protein
MWQDPIVAQVRQAREEHAGRLGFDLQAIYADLKEQEKHSQRTKVSFPPKRLAPAEQSDPAVAA